MSAIGRWAGKALGGATGGYVVQTPGAAQPYKVVLEYEDSEARSEHPVTTISEGEALIRQRSPKPALVNRSREWNSPL